MDGAAGLTQPEVPPGAEFVYDFAVPDAGTYWFHPHRNTLEQVSRGLVAPLIVEETDAPEVDHDLVLTINDWRLDDAAQIVADFGNMHDGSHDGRIGNHLTVNGRFELAQTVAQNQRLRLRVINAASDRVLRLAAAGLAGMVGALDGMPLAVPETFDALVLAPAQRVDLMLDVTAAAGEPAYLLSVERDGSYALANFTVQGAAAPVRPAIGALPSNRWVAPQLTDARSVQLLMEGGMMGGMMGATLPDGTARSMRELFGDGLAWALNGVAGMPDAPLIEVARGETVRMPIINRSVFAHAMHLHGHHFQQVTEAGLGPARDTILIEGEAQIEIAFVAENPGDWMFHCHMLAHQAAGMMTWLRVT
jgi:FtsP/CotA-like multicopper oxidase with cupredoxin domain